MAGRCRLILLLCTVLLVLTKCIDTKNDSQSPPLASTSATLIPKPATPSNIADSQSPPLASTSTTLTPTPVTPSNSTGLRNSASTSYPASTAPTKPALSPTTTPASSATAPSPSPTGCGSYNIERIPFGIEIRTSVDGSYTIVYQDGKNNSKTTETFNGLSHQIMKLCCNYTDIEVNGKTCNGSLPGNRTVFYDDSHTLKIEFNSSTRQVCHNAIWKNSGISFKVNNMDVEGSCHKINTTNKYCSSVPAIISSDECHLNKTEMEIEITPALKDIEFNQTRVWPVRINDTWPDQCLNKEDRNVTYACKNGAGSFPLEELKISQKYACTARVLYKGNNILPTYPKNHLIEIDTNCYVSINLKLGPISDTSVILKWGIHSEKCPHLLDEPQFQEKCRYVYSHTGKEPEKKDVNINQIESTDLKPYTEYKFVLMLQCYGEKVTEAQDKVTTDIGIPKGLIKPTIESISSNGFKILCSFGGELNGKDKKFKAKIKNQHDLKDTELINAKCEFEFKDLSYSTTYELTIEVCNEKLCSSPFETNLLTTYNEKALIGFLAFLVIVMACALLFVLRKIYLLRKRDSHDIDEQTELIQINDDKYLMNIEPITAELLLETYKRKFADEGRLFLAEFQSIPRVYSKCSNKEARKQCNLVKNRYVDILPYDFNRVQLSSVSGEAGSDYINASFIDGYKEAKKYIAAQGPKEETVVDFWRMIWEQQSSIIVMVTRCEEGNRIKCAQYWPSMERETEIFEEFVVKINGEDCCPDYIIRHLTIMNKKEKSTEREVTHIQFTSWPDHGVPEQPHLLLKLRRRVNAFKNFFSGPIVVHCSAGVGRTGTYISIDAMMEGLEAEGRMDIYGYVVKLRRQRCLMVQVEGQYILIHQTLIEYNQYGETEISLSELHRCLAALQLKDSPSDPTLLEAEFQRLPKYKNWRTCNTGINEENKNKNRCSSIIPYDYNRVLVKLEEDNSYDSEHEDDEDYSSDEEDEDSTKYINASYIDGYWGQRSLIAAQGPLSDTITDFWKMIFQKKVKAIIMLSECTEGGKEFCSPYWGDEKKLYDDIEVHVTSCESTPACIIRSIEIHHTKRNESRKVYQYHYQKWAERDLPENPLDLVDIIKNVKQKCGNRRAETTVPLVVHCNDGSSRTGIFCALWNILDSMETEKLVDVFQVVKALRKERQGMITDLEHYQFLYDVVEGAYPAQNGEVNPSPAAVADTVEMVDEKTVTAVTDSGQPEALTANEVQLGGGGAEEEMEEPAKAAIEDATEPSISTEKAPEESTSNGPSGLAEM